MYYKNSKGTNKYMIIAIFAIFAIIVIGIIAYLVSTSMKKESEKNSKVDAIKPDISYTLSTNEPDQEKVIIKVEASTKSDTGISKIILPNEFEVKGSVAEYQVEENGNYTFGVYSNDGQYNSVNAEVTNILVRTADKPYIPEGFKKVEGEPKNGMVIQDKKGNQFVWVPVPTGRMMRDKEGNPSYRDDSDISNEINNSVAKYKGIYIGRYETTAIPVGNNNNNNNNNNSSDSVPGILPGKIPWTNLKYINAKNAAESMAINEKYEGYKTALPTSAVWYTTIRWIDEVTGTNYSSSTDLGNYSGTVNNTGETSTDMVNNIADLAGNVKEWITETFSDRTAKEETTSGNQNQAANIFFRTLRGGNAKISNTPLKISAQSEDDLDPLWGFRIVLYKQ